MKKRLFFATQKWLMILFFLSVPVTSFPFFPSSFGGNSAVVRPLLVYPLLGLVMLVTLPRLFSQPLSKPVLILLFFFMWAVISSLVPFIRGVESPWREVSLFSRMLRTLITLVLAMSVYLTVALIPRNEDELLDSLRWLYMGLIMALIWGTFQAVYILDLVPNLYEWMNKLQGFISIHDLQSSRISGMTYEPSWFSDQILIIWLPFVLGASLTDYSLFPWRLKWVTIEKILLVWTFGILAFTLSRTGLVLGVGLIVFGALLNLSYLLFKGEVQIEREANKKKKRLIGGINSFLQKPILLISIAVLLFLALFILVGSQSGYISRIWKYWFSSGEKNFRDYFAYIGFLPRITYWQTAYNIFRKHPIFGVGLGNFTIYFSDLLPFVHLARAPELLRHLVPRPGRSRVLTAKHFLLRILAETGLVGMGIFLTFLLILLAGGFDLWLSEDEVDHFWGTVSILGVVAFVVDSFSFDSFAIPNPWITFGLITAAYRILNGGKEEEGD